MLLVEGIEDEEAKRRLYPEIEELACSGETWGELYKATIRRPSENMSAAVFRLLSSTKSGEQ